MRIALASSLFVGLVGLVGLAGCVAFAEPGHLDHVDPEPTTPVAAAGTYTVRTDVDLTVEALLPDTAANLVGTLRDFSTRPGATLLELAEQAGVPAVQTLRAYLPSYLEGKVVGWLDDELRKLAIGGVPVTRLAGDLAALADTALARFALDSELVIAPGGAATHTLTAIDLTPAGLDVVVAIDGLPGEVVSATATCAARDGALTLGEHGYAIRYGEHVWHALGHALVTRHGAQHGDVRGLLGAAVGCPALAQRVASQCYLGVCVGHHAELTAICERGLDEVVGRARARVTALRFDAVRFAAGTATLVDADRDGDAERLAPGTWTAEIDAGLGLRRVPATFTASR